jgi:signal transduction histidine kinase
MRSSDQQRIIVEHVRPARPSGVLAGMRVRKKLIFLHTVFSLGLAGVLAVAMWPAARRVVEEAEVHEARLAMSLLQGVIRERRAQAEAVGLGFDPAPALERVNSELPDGVRVAGGPLGRLMVPDAMGPLSDVRMEGNLGTARTPTGAAAVVQTDRDRGEGYIASARLEAARSAVNRLFVMLTVALLGVYGLIAVALEVLVLPRHVYGPIRALLRADRAAREEDRSGAIIPPEAMPADELGEIMRSRNRTIEALWAKERDLEAALAKLETAANDLKRKNHLLETAQRNLADADRLASLGVMSAGLAHELNTPLAVAKGLVEKMNASPAGTLPEAERALLLRVVGRLERLSESLLDFARVRPTRVQRGALAPLVDEAWTLVRLDREAGGITLTNAVRPGLDVDADLDRLTQVLVNLVRNAVDALAGGAGRGVGGGDARAGGTSGAGERAEIVVEAVEAVRDGREWVSISVSDNGPGLDPAVLGRLFEPFVSTRLDSRGTGLGLAVSEGIVREHGGMLLARNREHARGTVLEILLPKQGDNRPMG